MAGGIGAQLSCSFKRHYLNHIRQWPWLLGIVVVAVIPFALLAGLKSSVPPQHQDSCYFRARTVSTQYPLALLQSFVCNLPNECQDDSGDDTADAYPGAIINTLFNGTISAAGTGEDDKAMLSQLTTLPESIAKLTNLTQLLTNPNLTQVMENGLRVRDVIRSPDALKSVLVQDHNFNPEVVDAIFDSKIGLSRVMSLVGYRDINALVCSPDQLGQFLVAPARDIVNISASLCGLPSSEVQNISQIFVGSLDAENLFDKVSEVLSAIGGYEAQSLVQQVGGLLASLGRLEALAPLASTLSTMTDAISPLMSAMSTLESTGLDSESLSGLLSLSEGFFQQDSEMSTAAMRSSRNVQLLLSPENFTELANEVDELPDVWGNLLAKGVDTMNATMSQIANITKMIEKDPFVHTATTLMTSLLPRLMAPEPINFTSLGTAINTTVSRLLPEIRSEILNIVPYVRVTLSLATGSLKVVNSLAGWTNRAQPAVAFEALKVLSNVTFTKELLLEGNLANFMCSKSSWPNLNEEQWLEFKNQACDRSKTGNLYETEALFRPFYEEDVGKEFQQRYSSSNISQLFKELEEFSKELNISSIIVPTDESDWNSRRKRSLIDASDTFVSDIPPLVYAEERVANVHSFKYFIRNISGIYINLAKSSLAELKRAGVDNEIPNEIMIFFQTSSIEAVEGFISLVLDILVQIMQAMKSTWQLEDLKLTDHIRTLSRVILPSEAMETVVLALQVMENKTFDVPWPVPQILNITSAVNGVLNQIQQKQSVSLWAEDKLPYTYEMVQKMKVALPRILAIPYLISFNGVTSDMITLITKTTEGWTEYPCGDTSLTKFYPPASDISKLPSSWASLEDIKTSVKELEQYMCQNQGSIFQEIQSFDATLDKNVKNFMNGMGSTTINISASAIVIKDFVSTLSSFSPQDIIDDVGKTFGYEFLQELEDSFALSTKTTEEFFRMLLGVADVALVWLNENPDTSVLLDEMQFFMFHAKAMAEAILQLLDGTPSLARFIGLPEDYRPLQLLQEGPKGTAKFILQELSSLSVSALTKPPDDWINWGIEVCDRSEGKSAIVTLVCHVAATAFPRLQSPLIDALITANNKFDQGDLAVPLVTFSNMNDIGKELVEGVMKFDVTQLPTVARLWQFWNDTVVEAHVFFEGLKDLQKTWQFMMMDEAVKQNDQLLMVAKDAETIITWLNGRIPQNLDDLLSTLPSSLKEVHSALNTSWISLVDGLHHNFVANPDLVDWTPIDICVNASRLEDPEGDSGQFKEILTKICSLLQPSTMQELITWSKYQELVADLQKNRTFSSKILIEKSISLVTRVINMTQRALDSGMSLPTYLDRQKWEEITQKISSRESSRNGAGIDALVQLAIDKVTGYDQRISLELYKILMLKCTAVERLLAKNMTDLLMDYDALGDLWKTTTGRVPLALKDLVAFVSTKPDEVGNLIKTWLDNGGDWNALCALPLTQVGTDFNHTISQLCNINSQFLVSNLSNFLMVDVLRWTSSNLPSAVDKCTNSWSEFKKQLDSGELSRKLRDPIAYLELKLWTNLPSLVFNVNADTMWNNSTMILATLLEPLVSFSNSPTDQGQATKEALKKVDQVLRSLRLTLALIQGGDLWKALREAYVDKPVVNRFFDVIQVVPRFILEYTNFFRDYTVVIRMLFSQGTSFCSLHKTLIDENRSQIPEDVTNVLTTVVDFLCDQQSLSLLPEQLIPNSAPVIANITMELDAAMMAMLMDSIGWDVIYIIRGNFFEGPLKIPDWATEDIWMKIFEKIKSFLKIPQGNLMFMGSVIGLEASRQYMKNQTYFLKAVGVAYQVSTRVSQSINNNTGELNVDDAVSGLGKLTEFVKDGRTLLPEIGSIALWFPESKLYYSLMSGMAPSEVYDKMCTEGVDKWLHHPYLSASLWQTWQRVVCPANPISPEDFNTLLDNSEVVSGMTIDWMKVATSVAELIKQMTSVRSVIGLPEPQAEDYMKSLQNLSLQQRIVRGILSGTWFVQQRAFGETAQERHNMATNYIAVIEILKPLTSRTESLINRLTNLDSFKILLQEYANVVDGIKDGTSLLNYKYQVLLSPGLIPDMSMESLSEAYNTARVDTSHFEVLMSFREAVLNLTNVIFPADDSLRISPQDISDIFNKVTSNFIQSIPEVAAVVESPVCDYYSGEQWHFTFQNRGKTMLMVSRHLDMWDQYVQFTCNIPNLNITTTMRTLLEEYGWKKDLKEMLVDDQAVNRTLNCSFVFKQSFVIQGQLAALVSYYEENPEETQKLQTCVLNAMHSTTGRQYRGILEALGTILAQNSESWGAINTALNEVKREIYESSSSLKSLGSRITVLVPFSQILKSNFKDLLDLPPEVLDIFENYLWVDVNRIHGTNSLELSKLLNSKSGRDKVLKIIEKRQIKREASKEDIFELALENMDPEAFAQQLLEGVNETYLSQEIDNMRMEVLLSSDTLIPVMEHMNDAVATLSELSKLQGVMDLNKIIIGEVDPVSFLTGSVQLTQMRLWSNLAESFSKILNSSIPLIAGSELEEDVEQVITGVNHLQGVVDLATLDFTIPLTSLIANWSSMEKYLENTLGMDPSAIEALSGTELNLMEVLSLEDVTLSELICKHQKMESVVTLPTNTSIELRNITHSLCNYSDPEGLASTFLQHLDIGPLMGRLTLYGVNATLSTFGLDINHVLGALQNLKEVAEYIPQLMDAILSLKNAINSDAEFEQMRESELEMTLIEQFASPDFLKRAGKIICGEPLQLVPDSLGLLSVAKKNNASTRNKGEVIHAILNIEKVFADEDICKTLDREIRSLPGGQVLIHFIKPLMKGKIFYAPQNAVTEKIIAQANGTFSSVAEKRLTMASIKELTANMGSANSSSDLEKLEAAFQMPWLKGMIEEIFPEGLNDTLLEQISQTSPKLKQLGNMTKEFSDLLEVGAELLSCINVQRFFPAENEEELVEMSREAVLANEFLAGIVFSGVDGATDSEDLPTDMTYSIRVDYENTPSTYLSGPRFWRPGPYANMAIHMRYHQGFLLLQDMIDSAILHLHLSNSYPDNDNESHLSRRKRDLSGQSQGNSNVNSEKEAILNMPIYTRQQPYPCFEKDDFMGMLSESPVMSLVLSFVSFTIFMVFLIQQLAQEQKSRNKQLQEVMGLKVWLDHLVWFFYSLCVLMILLLLLTLITKFGGIQPNVNLAILFIFFLCYGISLISFCYLITCVIESPILAVFVGIMAVLVFNVPFISISVLESRIPQYVKIIACLLPPSAFGFGFRIICQYELMETSANFNNLWISPIRGSEMTLGLAMVMLLADFILFYILSFIVNAIKTGLGGYKPVKAGGNGIAPYPVPILVNEEDKNKTSNNFTFNIFQVTCCSCGTPNKVAPPAKGSLDILNSYPLDGMKKESIRTLDVDPGLKQSYKKGLSIVGLRKIYQQRGRSKVAVDNLNLELYEGQVLALLGHNGAGKTTIISIITRELEATAGNVKVYGHDVRTSWTKARSLIGLCPQQSVLFPLMTVHETLRYYASLKGTPKDQVEMEVNTTLVDMGLFEHRRYLGHQLSEGLRRRLCLAIAFVGGSKLIILDEPTSGVDPAARTAMWEVISSNRGGRTILLTTHHLDEAETLADRVAILHQGRLLCVGSPLSLKSEYGSGYSITLSNRSLHSKPEREIEDLITQRPKDKSESAFTSVKFATPNTTVTWDLVRRYVPNAKLLEAVNGELTYSLPLLDAGGQENRISEMFGELESRLEELGFSSLEIRPTNLEDVIIALNTINSIDSNSVAQSRVTLVPEAEKEDSLKEAYNFKPRTTLEGTSLGFQRFRAVLRKRLLSHIRSWVFYVQMFLVPLIFIILAMLGSTMRPIFEEAAPLTLSPDIYDSSVAFVRNLDPSMSGLKQEILGDGNLETCPAIVDKGYPGELSCNITATFEEDNCICNDDLCWMDVVNQTSLNNWLLATSGQYIQKRYGGLSLGVPDPRAPANTTPGATVWYDNAGYHALPAYINVLNNARLRMLVSEKHKITTINHPIKFSSYSFSSASLQQHVADLGIGLLILVSLTVVTSATAGYVVAERVRGERRVLYVAGLNRSVYWAANMLWDVLVLLLNIAMTAVVLVIFNQQQFIFRENLGAFVVLSLLYCLSMLPIFYLVENVFKSEAMAVFTFFSVNFAIALITTLILITCQFYTWVATLQEMGTVVKYLFMIFPPFTYACGIKDLSMAYTKTAILARFDMDVYVSPFSWDIDLQGGLGLHFVTLAAWAVLSTIVLHVWRDCLGPLPQPPSPAKTIGGSEEDKDVAAERIKIQCGGASLYDTVLRMVGLGRDFTSPPSVAVSNLFLALKRGECFSLLGLNGAGKTTTFRCVTGDLRPSRGQILINGQLLHEALALPRAVMGYCPQSHALDGNLTPREALHVMAFIRGFPSKEISPILDRVLEKMGLSAEQNNYISHLSGGTKRKVSAALALLGNPLLVLLDEPTTGLDPASRRGIWSAIKSVTQDGRTVLLTSHSMDEVNVLSHRMAVMVNGHFVCMGSPHYLKNKLGDKYTIKLKTKAIEDMTAVVDYLRSQLTDILLKEQHHLTLVVEVSRKLPLRLIFNCLNASQGFGVTEYDVSQTTLDEVFRLLTSYQGDGQLPPPPVGNDEDVGDVPIHLNNLHPAGVILSPEPTFQKPDLLFNPSSRLSTGHSRLSTPASRLPTAEANNRLPSVETDVPISDRTSYYDNVGDPPQQEIYATVGRHRTVRPSPDIESLRSESGSAEDSPEEEWTHL